MRLLSIGLGLALTACGGHKDAPCADVEGAFELVVTGTGQSETQAGPCPGADTTQTIDLALSHGQVSLGDETCAVCSTAGCLVDVVCGQSVTCPSTVTPPAAPADTFVQELTFVVPDGDAATGNAVVTLGPSYCRYEGTAVAKRP